MPRVKKTSKKSVSKAAVKTNPSVAKRVREIELDLKTLLTPLAIIIGALIISIPISLSVYFGLKDANLGGVAGAISAADCTSSDNLSDACFVKYAQEVGLDDDKFQQCIKDKSHDGVVQEELDYGTEIGVQGTPTVVVGENKDGKKMTGFMAGAGVTKIQLENLKESIEKNGINKAASDWKNIQLQGLSTYESQLTTYYQQQGQSGDTLKNTVKTALDQRKSEIEEESKVKDYDYGKGELRGDKKAKFVVMEFSDYECPYCQQFAKGEVGLYIKEAADKNDMLFVYREFPLESIHPRARASSNAAKCAGEQDKYFDYHDTLFGLSSN